MSLLNKVLGEEPFVAPVSMLLSGEDPSKGNTGEWLIAYALEHGIAARKKIYRNLLVPSKSKAGATEVDVLML